MPAAATLSPPRPPEVSAAARLTLLLASSMTVMAGAAVAPALPKIAETFAHLPQAETLSKMALTLPGLFIALGSPLSGWIVDRYGRKPLLLSALVLYFVAGTSGFYLDDLYLILVGRALLGVAVAGTMTTVSTLVGDYFEGEARDRFASLQGAFMSGGGIVFLTLSGFLADLNWHYAFLVYGLALVVLALSWALIPEPQVERSRPGQKRPAAPYPRLTLWIIYATSFLGVMTYYMVPTQLPYLVKESFGATALQSGLAIAASTLTGTFGALGYRFVRRVLCYRGVFALIFLLMFLACQIIGHADSYAVVLLGSMTGGFGMGMMLPNTSLWIMSFAPAPLRGKLMGGMGMAVFLSQFCSPLVVAPLIDWSGTTAGGFRLMGFVVLALSLAYAASRVPAVEARLKSLAR